MNHPLLEPVEPAREHQRIEDDQAPEGDPVDGPETGEAAVEVRLQRIHHGRMPYQNAKHNGDYAPEDRGKPGGEAKSSEHIEQGGERDHGDEYGEPQISRRIERLLKHVVSQSPFNTPANPRQDIFETIWRKDPNGCLA